METMSPDLFHIDYGRLFETLITIIVFSFFIERALAVIFESSVFIAWIEGRPETKEVKDPDGIVVMPAIPAKAKKKGLKELISALVSIGFCILFQFDAITIILQSSDKMTYWGFVLTGLIISGGSKASIKLFHDVLGVMSNAERMRKEQANTAPTP